MIKILFTIQPRGLLTQVCDELMRNSFTFLSLQVSLNYIHILHTDFLLASFKSRKISFDWPNKNLKTDFPRLGMGMLAIGHSGRFKKKSVAHLCYRLIILKKFLLLNILSKHFTAYSTQQYCDVKFSFKFFDKMANKKGILKSIDLYVIKMKKEDPTQPTITYAASVF